MRTSVIFLAIAMVQIPCLLLAQQDSIARWYEKGIVHLKNEAFDQAIDAFRLSKTFSGTLPPDIDKQMELAFRGNIELLRNAREKLEKESAISKLAIKGYQMINRNPTIALRIAEAITKMDSPQKQTGQALLRDMLDKPLFNYCAGYFKFDQVIHAISISPDGKNIAVGSEDQNAYIIDLKGNIIQTFSVHKEAVSAVAFSPNGKLLITGSFDNTICVWDCNNGQLIRRFEAHKGDVTTLLITPDGNTIISGGADQYIKWWGLDGNELRAVKAHDGTVNEIELIPNLNLIASCGSDKLAKLWNATGQLVASFKGHQANVSGIAVSADANMIATASWDRTIRLWNLEGELIRELKGHVDAVETIAFSPDGLYLASGSDDAEALLWNTRGEIIQRYGQHERGIKCVAFSPDSKLMVTASSLERSIATFNIQGIALKTICVDSAAIMSMDINEKKGLILFANNNNTAYLFDLSGKLLASLKRHDLEITSVAISQDGQYLLTGSVDDYVIKWGRDGSIISRFKNPEGDINAVSFSPDGQHMLYAGWEKAASVIDNEGNILTTITATERLYDACFSPDGLYILTGSMDNMVNVWDLQGKLMYNLKGHTGPVNCVNYSPDGNYILTGSVDKTAKLWNAKGGLIATLSGHKGIINEVHFSPDMKYLLTASDDGSARIWNLQGNELQVLRGHNDKIKSARFSSDGNQIITAGLDGCIRFWMRWDFYLNSDLVMQLTDEQMVDNGLLSDSLSIARVNQEKAQKKASAPPVPLELQIAIRQKMILRSDDMQTHYVLSMRFSVKAHTATSPEERVAMQLKSVEECEYAFANRTLQKENYDIISWYYSSLAIWEYSIGNTEKAQVYAEKSISYECNDFVKPFLNARRAFILGASGQKDLAKIDILANKAFVLNGNPKFNFFYGGVTGYPPPDDKLSVTDLIKSDIAYLESLNITDPFLKEFSTWLQE